MVFPMSSADPKRAENATPDTVSLLCATPERTAALAGAMAPRLVPGDRLWLEGPIGAGKTHFARALIQARLAAADRLEDVPSPTFTLVQTYDDGQAEIWHADLYRLTDPADCIELGLDDAFRDAITLVEWPDRLPPDMRAGGLTLRFAVAGEDARRITFETAEPEIARRLFPAGDSDDP